MSQTKSFGDSKSFGCIPFVSGWLRRKHEKKEAIFRDMLQKQIKNVEKYMPFTRLLSFNLYTDNEIEDLQENEILIEITFSVESLNLQSSVEVIF